MNLNTQKYAHSEEMLCFVTELTDVFLSYDRCDELVVMSVFKPVIKLVYDHSRNSTIIVKEEQES